MIKNNLKLICIVFALAIVCKNTTSQELLSYQSLYTIKLDNNRDSTPSIGKSYITDAQGELFLDYQGIDINLDNRAVIGDRFVVDGNNLGPNGSFDGQGNNSNILRFVDLESKSVLPGGQTISEGYLKFVGDVGNVATQSEIARDALTIVQQQAIEAKDRVSGVSLDKEAADLIRFQQAYQASAQVMQVATKLFDTVLQVR